VQPAPDLVDVAHQGLDVGVDIAGRDSFRQGVHDLADVGRLVGGRGAAGLADQEPAGRAHHDVLDQGGR
jgi:hypothetical protein